MKNFWKEYSVKTLERYLVEAIHYKWDYCLSFKEIPSDDFVQRHREAHLYEFLALEKEGMHESYQREYDE